MRAPISVRDDVPGRMCDVRISGAGEASRKKLSEGKLRRYTSLALGSLTACWTNFESCEAALVFTAPDVMIDPDSDPTEGRVDMTGDGVAEIGVIVGSASLPDVNGNTGIVLGGGLDGAAIAFEGRYPMAFEASELITASLSFRTAIGTLAFSSGGLLGSRGEWFSGRDAYLGTRFQVDDEIYYGWVHVIWDPESNTVNLGLSAYEDSGEAALIAPQPAEPEDFRLTLLEGTDIEAGRVELSWPMLAGKTYELQRTTDLENWETIYAVTPYIDGEEIFMDEDFDPVHSPQRFYRVKQSESSLLMLALGIPTRRRRKAGA